MFTVSRKWRRSKTRSNEKGADTDVYSAPVSFDPVFEDFAEQTETFRRQMAERATRNQRDSCQIFPRRVSDG